MTTSNSSSLENPPPKGTGAMRVGVDMSMGHPPFPPTMPATGSFITSVEMISAVRQTDKYVIHCGAGCHVPIAVTGSTYTTVDMLPIHMVGMACNCGDMAAKGSLIGFSG